MTGTEPGRQGPPFAFLASHPAQDLPKAPVAVPRGQQLCRIERDHPAAAAQFDLALRPVEHPLFRREARGMLPAAGQIPRFPSFLLFPRRQSLHEAHELNVGEEEANGNVNPLFSSHVRSLLSTFGQAASRRALRRQAHARAHGPCFRLQRRPDDPPARHPQQPERSRAGAADHAVGPGSLLREEPSRLQRLFHLQRQGRDRGYTTDMARAVQRGRRCLIPAEGFFEWKTIGPKEKQPYASTVGEGNLFAFAGLWDAWHDKKTNQWLQSFAIITTKPNELTGTVHTRMPVILHERDYDEWLLRNEGPPPIHLMQPFPASEMQAREVSRDVGNVRNNYPELLNSK